jgi:hypothetical protein
LNEIRRAKSALGANPGGLEKANLPNVRNSEWEFAGHDKGTANGCDERQTGSAVVLNTAGGDQKRHKDVVKNSA